MSGHAILKNLYEKKMDVILTISFKITAEIEIRRHIFCVLLRGVSALYSICFSFIHCHEMPSHKLKLVKEFLKQQESTLKVFLSAYMDSVKKN